MSEVSEPASTVADVPTSSASPPDEPSNNFGVRFLGVCFFLGLIAAVAAVVIEIPYFSLEPGDTFSTEEFVEVDGTDSFPSDGEVSFVTVTQRRLTPITWLFSTLRDSDEIFHEDLILGDQTIDEQREENALLMLTSQNNAIASALDHLGYETAEPAGVVIIDIVEGGALDGVFARNDVISEVDGAVITESAQLFEILSAPSEPGTTIEIVAARPGSESRTFEVELTSDTRGFLGIAGGVSPTGEGSGAFVDQVIPDGASVGILEDGDHIVGFEGNPVTSFDDLVPGLLERRSGESVSLDVVRGEETLAVSVELGVRALERAGILNADTQFRDAELPFDVGFTTENVGGPSAGLAFTLTVLDVLTEGELTGGANIVVTGAIDREGNVGRVGGLHQKSFAALDDDADVFIVPESNFEEARAAVDSDLRIESVNTLEEALDVIAEFGGNADQLPTDGSL